MVYSVAQNQLLPNYLKAYKSGLDIHNNQRKMKLMEQQLAQKAQQENLLQSLGQQYMSGDENVLSQLAATDPQYAGQLLGIKDKMSGPQAPFEGTAFDSQLGNLQYQGYIAQGIKPGEAARMAANDVLKTKRDVFVDPSGRVVERTRGTLPKVTPELLDRAKKEASPAERQIAQKVAQAPMEQKQAVLAQEMQQAREQGEDVDDIMDEDFPQAVELFDQLGQSFNDEAPVVSLARQEERAKLSERRRNKIIEDVYSAADTAESISQNVNTIRSNLDSLVANGDTTGPVTPIITFMNDLGSQLGLNINLDETSSLTQIEGASNQLAVPLVKMLGVNPTDKDFAIIKSTVARAGTSSQANYQLLYALDQVARRQKALGQIVENAQAEGANEVELKRRKRMFNKKSHIKIPVGLPKTKEDVKEGQLYSTPRGVFEFNGEGMVRVF